MRRVLIALCLLLSSLPARAQDAIDLHQATVHSSPADVADWPITVAVHSVKMSSPAGLSFEFEPTLSALWDYHVAGWGKPEEQGKCPADGCILYTVWAVARVNGAWHAAGFIQMWAGRAGTGAPILTDFHKNWAYASRWGALNEYVPQPGDEMGFFVTAGNARDERNVTSRRERSNVVMVKLPVGDVGSFTFDAPPSPPSLPPSPAPVVPTIDLTPLLQRLDALERADAELRARLATLEAKPVPIACSAALNFGGTKIPISCRLQ